MQPIGTVIILNWNGGDAVLEAVEAVLDQTLADRLKVVVVDNASTDGSDGQLLDGFGGRIELIRSETNLGFDAGNNLGFRRAEGEFVFVLNNDAVPEPRWTEAMVDAVRACPGAGMATPKILNYAERRTIDCAGHMMYPDGLNRSRGNLAIDRGQFDTPDETCFPSGCAALYRRDAIEEWGGFDDDFFAYGDDADIGLKMRMAGYSCRYVPEAVVYHHGSLSSGRFSPRKLFLVERNRVWVMLKYFPVSWILASPWHTLRRLWASWRAARRGEGVAAGVHQEGGSSLRVAGVLLRAWAAALWGAPKMWRKRRALWRRSRISMGEMKALLRRFRASVDEMAFGAPGEPLD